MKIIGLDIGTTKLCGILYDTSSGHLDLTLYEDNVFMSGFGADAACQDPKEIYRKIEHIFMQLITASTEPVTACSLSSQMHGIVYLDASGEPLTPFYTWMNQFGKRKKNGISVEKTVSEEVGFPVYTGYGIVTNAALPSIPDQATVFCNIGDYVCMKLSGKKRPVCDVSIAASLGIWNPSTGKVVGNNSLFPEIAFRPTVVGCFHEVPVVQALGDNQASFLGAVPDLNHTILINYGTSGQLSFFSPNRCLSTGFEIRPIADEGFLHVASSICGGDAFAILASFFRRVLVTFGCENKTSIVQMMDSFDFSTITDPMTCEPFFLGRRGNSNAAASFSNVTKSNFTPTDMTFAVLKGMAEELYKYFEMIPEEIRKEKNILAGAGNGLKKNIHLIRIVEELYRRKLFFRKQTEESCVGAVLQAEVGIGLFPSFSLAIEKLRAADVLNPD